VLLREVEPGDVDAYVRMRCDPAMMAELGGPLPRDGIEAKFAGPRGSGAGRSDAFVTESVRCRSCRGCVLVAARPPAYPRCGIGELNGPQSHGFKLNSVWNARLGHSQ
jgi:hypothetical protein